MGFNKNLLLLVMNYCTLNIFVYQRKKKSKTLGLTNVKISDQQYYEHIFTLNEGGEEGGNSLAWITCCITI